MEVTYAQTLDVHKEKLLHFSTSRHCNNFYLNSRTRTGNGMEVVYSEVSGKLLSGENKKCTGERRQWTDAKCTGRFRRGVRSDRQLQVKEGKMTKWVTIESFTGTVGNIQLIEGRDKKGNVPFDWR